MAEFYLHVKKQSPARRPQEKGILLQWRCESIAWQIHDIYRPRLAPYPRNLIPKDSEISAFQRLSVTDFTKGKKCKEGVFAAK